MSDKKLNPTDAQMLRIKAEERLKTNQLKVDKPITETDAKRLMHELQVHQIELEIQNEELRQANEIAEAALKKYTMLYDFSPMGYFILDADGSICELNFSGAEMLHEKRFALVNSNFKLFIAKKSLPIFNTFFSNVFTSGAKESCEISLGYDDHPLCTVYMEGIVTGDDRKCLLSVVDLSSLEKLHHDE